MHDFTFYACKKCGGVILKAHGGDKLDCCGEAMSELVPNTTEAATEKHIPVTLKDGNKLVVTVGGAKHPMEEKHFIEWIYLVTDSGTHSRHLHPGEEPVAEFLLSNEKPVAVYERCNIHGLWKADV